MSVHRLASSVSGPGRRLPRAALALAALLGLTLVHAPTGPAAGPEPERLTSCKRAPAPEAKPVPVGEEVRTEANQRRRVVLPDGSVLFLNQNTTVKLTAERRLTLSEGEVFVEAAPRRAGADGLVVEAPGRGISAAGSTFAVRASKAGSGVLVTRGLVKVGGRDLRAGQQLEPGGDQPAPAPRASHPLDWTRELMITADSPLLPASPHAGGALVAIDPDGQEAKLSLRKYHVDVHIEEGFARTTIDQTYFNHHAQRLEGTFYFPLPPDASLSRLAMYVDGNLMEGGMVERDYGRAVYESIVHRQKDPALLEWVDGSTFKMRVFPLEGRQEKRIILSYTQRLPMLYGRADYRFSAGHSLEVVRDWSFHARVKNGAGLAWNSASHALTDRKDGADLLLDASARHVKAAGDIQLSLLDPRQAREEPSRFSSFEHEGARYLMLRYRPNLPIENRQSRIEHGRSWVFLFESSGDRDPLLARVQIDIIRSLLANAEPDDTFAVLAAGTRVRALAAEPRPITPENVQAAVAFLESAQLVGALDLGRALNEAGPFLKAGKDPYLVHVGSGIAAMGERREDVLAKRIPDGTRYVGIGVGRRWARSFMKAAAERTGGYFTQINPNEPVSWRTFELSATLRTPRLLNVQVADGDGRVPFLSFAGSAAQDEEIAVVARLDAKAALPASVVVTGTLDSQPFRKEVPVKDVTKDAGYLPRTWARLEIERLLAEDAMKNKDQIIALSKAMYVVTPFTSLLVLENEDMYAQYKVDRGRKDHWAMYPCPPKIPVVYEPDPDHPDAGKGGKPTAKQVMDSIVMRQRPGLIGWSGRENAPANVIPIINYRDVGMVNGIEPPPVEFPPVTVWSDPKPLKFINDFLPVRLVAGLTRGTFTSDLGGHVRPSGFAVASPAYGGFPGMPEMGRPSGVQPLAVSGGEAGVDFKNFRNDTSARSQTDSLGSLRMRELLQNAEDLRQIDYEWERIWFTDQLSHLTPERVHGGVNGGGRASPLSLLYQRPSFSGDERMFFDLVAYAPGMNTTRADIQAVLEAEVVPTSQAAPGKIEPAARRLLDKARPAGWMALTIPGEAGRPGYTVLFDGAGRYVYERVLSLGLRERVVCDGKTLLHLYPDLGLGARRAVSRHHRIDFAGSVPWALPPAEDLARGADLKTVGERTVAIVSHGAEAAKDADGKPVSYVRLHLVFADGRLAERQAVEIPAGKVLLREVIAADGTIRVHDGDGKELAVRKATLSAGKEPDLAPDVKKLVVLPLPYRGREHVRQALQVEKKPLEELRFEDAITLFATEFAGGNGPEALNIFRRSLHSREQRQLGFYVLLAACGQNLDAQNVDVLSEHMQEPLAQYLALYSSPVLRRHASQWAVGTGQWADGFLGHLALSHALYQRWQGGPKPERSEAERKRALDYVRRNKGSAFGWALLTLLQDRAGDDPAFHAALAELFALFEDTPGLGYAARYEHARSLGNAGRRDEARQRFRTLYEKTLQEDRLPPIDADFRQALLGAGKEQDQWSELLRKTAARLIEQKRRPAVLALAKQCGQLDDQPLANHLLAAALDGIPDDKERVPLTLAVIGLLMETGQLARADEMLQTLLADPEQAKQAERWRLAAQLAGRRDRKARALECLERALDAEYQAPLEVINLRQVREDYQSLLSRYQALADAMVTLQVPPPPDFLAKVVHTADRWRALDTDGAGACQSAGRILQTLGERELAWDYLTTPVGLQPNESAPWVGLAGTLAQQGEADLADRAYTAAFEAEPTNAQVLYDRAQHLRQAGRPAEARKLLRQLADGDWQPRFRWLQTQARWQLDGSR